MELRGTGYFDLEQGQMRCRECGTAKPDEEFMRSRAGRTYDLCRACMGAKMRARIHGGARAEPHSGQRMAQALRVVEPPVIEVHSDEVRVHEWSELGIAPSVFVPRSQRWLLLRADAARYVVLGFNGGEGTQYVGERALVTILGDVIGRVAY